MLVVLAVFGLAVLWTFMGDADTATEYGYGQLIDDARTGKIQSIEKEDSRLTVSFADGTPDKTAVVPSELTNVFEDLGCSNGDPGEFNCANFTATDSSSSLKAKRSRRQPSFHPS